MQAGLENFNQQPCSPESCHSVTHARVLHFVKAAPFFPKSSLQQSHFRGRKHIGFLDSKKWSSPVQHVDVCVCVLPIPELIQSYHLTTFICLRTGPPITFHFACLCCLGGLVGLFGFWCRVCCLGCGCVFFCCCFLMDCDGCWTMYRSFSSPLLWLPSLMAAPGMH